MASGHRRAISSPLAKVGAPLWAKADEAFVDLQTFDEPPLEGEKTAEDAQHIDVIRSALEDCGEEFQLEIELFEIRLSRGGLARGV